MAEEQTTGQEPQNPEGGTPEQQPGATPEQQTQEPEPVDPHHARTADDSLDDDLDAALNEVGDLDGDPQPPEQPEDPAAGQQTQEPEQPEDPPPEQPEDPAAGQQTQEPEQPEQQAADAAMARLRQEFPEHFPSGQDPADVQRNLHVAARYARQNPLAYIRQLADQLGVDLSVLGGQPEQPAGQQPEAPEEPEDNPLAPNELDTPFEAAVKQQLSQVGAVRQDVQQLTEAQQQQAQAAVNQHIETFMAERDPEGNPVRPHFQKPAVKAEMNRRAATDPAFQQGRATDADLHRIYEESAWAVPESRQELINDLRSAGEAPAEQAPAAPPAPAPRQPLLRDQVHRPGGGFTQAPPNTENVNGLDMPPDLDTETGEDIDYILNRQLPG